jgi:hypothetical protein
MTSSGSFHHHAKVPFCEICEIRGFLSYVGAGVPSQRTALRITCCTSGWK